MEKLVELFKAACQTYGCPDWFADEVVFILLLIGFVFTSIQLVLTSISKLIIWKNKRSLYKNLDPFFTSDEVNKAIRNFIPTVYQNVAPSLDDEPGNRYIASAKGDLIPLFMKKVFRRKGVSGKFYLILADSGMGKSTFLVNLYIKYKYHLRFPFSPPKNKIRLLSFGYPDVKNHIESIDDQERTILLLDAFDEDLEASKNYENRLKDILSEVNKI